MSIETTFFILAWIVCALVGAAIGYAKNRLALGATLGAAGGLIGVAIIPPDDRAGPRVLNYGRAVAAPAPVVVLEAGRLVEFVCWCLS